MSQWQVYYWDWNDDPNDDPVWYDCSASQAVHYLDRGMKVRLI